MLTISKAYKSSWPIFLFLLFFICLTAVDEVASQDLHFIAEQFAPILRFDQMFGTGTGRRSKCFPSDPQPFYDQRQSEELSPIQMCNQNYQTIASDGIPVFYIAEECDPNVLIIRYWVFFAWQSTCFMNQGAHEADWECITVMIEDNQLKRVAFHQHGGWYILNSEEFQIYQNTHPVVYVGKNSHGFYHDEGGTGGCLYFQDFRNPGKHDYHLDTWNNLVPLRRGCNVPSWMNCSDSDEFCFSPQVGHPIDQTERIGLCSMAGCNKRGCFKSQFSEEMEPFIEDLSFY